MRTRETVKIKLIDLICDWGGIALIDFEESNLNESFADNNLDSLDEIELVMETEEEFDIEIPDEDVDQFSTPNEFIEYIYKQLEI